MASLEENLARPSIHLEAVRAALDAVRVLCESPADETALGDAVASVDEVRWQRIG